MGDARVALNGGGNQTIYVNVYRDSQNYGGNYSTYRSYGIYESGGYGSWTNATQYWSANLGGVGLSGTFTIPSPGKSDIWLYDYWWNRGHDGNGYGSDFNACFSVDTNHSSIGDGTACAYEGYPPRIPKVPQPPGAPTFSNVTPTSVTVTWSGSPDNMGAGIDSNLLRRNTNSNPDASGYVDTSTGAGTTTVNVTGLTPGTTYYFKTYAHNSQGYSGGSATTSIQLPVADPPVMTLTAAVSGTSMTVGLAPPGGASGVTKYTLEWRPVGGATTSVETSSPPLTVSGLTPGAAYEYRSSAWFGTYQSPWTSWTAFTQPAPNVAPGDYFDGNTTDKPDIDYQWSGTANNSTSLAVGRGVDGWSGAADGSKPFVIQQVTGGVLGAGSFSARMTFLADLTAIGAWIGQGSFSSATKNAEVVPGATYVGSIYVMPSRAQGVNAAIVWLTAALAVAGTSNGVGVLCPANAFTRLTVTGVAPATAKYAMVVADDDSTVAGWTIWKAGEWIQGDAAMLTLTSLQPYFDGDTPDDATYIYAWEGTAKASESSRTLAPITAFDPLADPDCPPIPLPPQPPAIAEDCIIEVGEWYRYWVQIPDDDITRWTSMLPSVQLVTGRGQNDPNLPPEGVRQVRIRYYPNPDNLPPQNFIATDQWTAEQIITYIPPFSILTLDAVSQRVWAQVGGEGIDPLTSNVVAGDHLLYGTGGGPATWPVLSCGYGWLVSLDIPPGVTLTPTLALTERML